MKHKNVIPTLRKIYNVDFFLRIGDEIIPFDLKITHISDDYFELASRGITPSSTGHDDFITNTTNRSELEHIKDYYKTYKRKHRDMNLPNINAFSKPELKSELAKCIVNLDLDAKQFVLELQKQHVNYVPADPGSLKKLEWWNYKYQGERLFCNNNRLFVFLAYKTDFIDGRNLKGDTNEIGILINELLDNLSASSINTIHYHYDKEASLAGDYTALSLSTIYSK